MVVTLETTAGTPDLRDQNEGYELHRFRVASSPPDANPNHQACASALSSAAIDPMPTLIHRKRINAIE